MTSVINLLMETCQRAERCPDFDLHTNLLKLQHEIQQNKITFNQSAIAIISAAQIYGYKVDHIRALCLNFKCTEEDRTSSNKHKLNAQHQPKDKAKRIRTQISDGCLKEFKSKEIHCKTRSKLQDPLFDQIMNNNDDDHQEHCSNSDEIEDILTRLEDGVYQQINLLQRLNVKESRPRLKDKDDKLELEKDSRANYTVYSGYIMPNSKCIVNGNEYERQLLDDEEIGLLPLPDTLVSIPILSLPSSRRSNEVNTILPLNNKVPNADDSVIDNDEVAVISEPPSTKTFTNESSDNPLPADNLIVQQPEINDDISNNVPSAYNPINDRDDAVFCETPTESDTKVEMIPPLPIQIVPDKINIRESVDTGFGSDPTRRSVSDVSDLDNSAPVIILHDVFGPKPDVNIPTIDGLSIRFTHEPLILNFLKLPPISAFQARNNYSIPNEFRLAKRKRTINDKPITEHNTRKLARIETAMVTDREQRCQSVDFFGFESLETNENDFDSIVNDYDKQMELIDHFAERLRHLNCNECVADNPVNDTIGTTTTQTSCINESIVTQDSSNTTALMSSTYSFETSGEILNSTEIIDTTDTSEILGTSSFINQTTTEQNNTTVKSTHDSGFFDETIDDNDGASLTPTFIESTINNTDEQEIIVTKNQYAQKATEIQEMEERVRLWHESLREKMTFQRDYDIKLIANDIKRIRDEKPKGFTFAELLQHIDNRMLGRYFWSVLQLANENEVVLHHGNNTSTVCEWSDFWIVKGDGNVTPSDS